MNFEFYFGHPAHYHLFKNAISILRSHGHTVEIVIKPKDVLEELLKSEGLSYTKLSERKQNSRLSLIGDYSTRMKGLVRILRGHRPDVLVGTSWENAQAGRLLGIPSITWNEDDSKVVPLFARFCYPFTDAIVAPRSCTVGRWESKTIPYPGYHELAYLTERYFKPDSGIVRRYIGDYEPFFVLRLANLSAHHDRGITGITYEVARHLIDRLKNRGNLVITSEKNVPEDLAQYCVSVPPKDMHHLLSFAKIYIGDSQTMAAEAAVLGTPSLRFNDFVGRLGYLEELEHRYHLSYGVVTGEPDKLYAKVDELLSMPNLREEWQARRRKMLSEQIDVTDFMVWLIENYPLSLKTARHDQHFQDYLRQGNYPVPDGR